MYNGDKEKKLVEHILDNLNSGISFKEFCEAMSKEHRSLQQEFSELCFWWLEKCREMYEQGNYDGRNVYGCKAGKMLMDFYDGK